MSNRRGQGGRGPHRGSGGGRGGISESPQFDTNPKSQKGGHGGRGRGGHPVPKNVKTTQGSERSEHGKKQSRPGCNNPEQGPRRGGHGGRGRGGPPGPQHFDSSTGGQSGAHARGGGAYPGPPNYGHGPHPGPHRGSYGGHPWSAEYGPPQGPHGMGYEGHPWPPGYPAYQGPYHGPYQGPPSSFIPPTAIFGEPSGHDSLTGLQSYVENLNLDTSSSKDMNSGEARGRGRGRGRYRGGSSREKGKRTHRGEKQNSDVQEEDDNDEDECDEDMKYGDNKEVGEEHIEYKVDENEVFCKILNGSGAGMITMDSLAQSLSSRAKAKKDLKAATNWVKQRQRRFRFATKNPSTPGEVLVSVYMRELKSCYMYTGDKGCHKKDCEYLHICRGFIRGSCNLGKKCQFQHDLQDARNKGLVKKLGLDVFTENQVFIILRRSTPFLCLDLNTKSGCSEGGFCTNFHLCERYVANKCFLPEKKCPYSHKFDSDHTRFLLESFNMAQLPKEMQQKLMVIDNKCSGPTAEDKPTVKGTTEVDGRSSKPRLSESANIEPEENDDSDTESVTSSASQSGRRRRGRGRRGRNRGRDDNHHNLGKSREILTEEILESSIKYGMDAKTILPALLVPPYQGKCTLEEMAELLAKVSGKVPDAASAKAWVLANHRTFRLLVIPDEPSCGVVIVKIAGLKLCFNYSSKKGCDESTPCGYFHFCRDFIVGHCERSTTGTCRYPHDILNPHNAAMAQNRDLQGLGDLLIQALRSSTAKVCAGYNSATGCNQASLCTDVHICNSFLVWDCPESSECHYSHDLKTPHNERILQLFQIDRLDSNTQKKMIIARKVRKSESSTSRKPTNPVSPSKAVKTPGSGEDVHFLDSDSDICEHFVRTGGRCQHAKQCYFHHYHLPYAWQFKAQGSEKWALLQEDYLEIVEEHYSQPCVSQVEIGGTTFNFEKMVRETNIPGWEFPLRRLSTPSYCDRKQLKRENSFATVWLWYWQDDNGSWIPYSKDGEQPFQDVLEAKFQDKDHSCYFEKGRFAYKIDFKEMCQINTDTKKLRPLQRRPVFVSPDNVKKRVFPITPQRKYDPIKLPRNWAPMNTCSNSGYDLAPLHDASTEKTRVQKRFQETLSNVKIIDIYRVQNLEEWNTYNVEKEKIKEKVEVDSELELFHGSDSIEVIKGICYQNFDPRCYGKNATVYGKGAYFAQAASYSHRYAREQPNGNRYMFLANVTVGRYTKGDESMQRPPKINPNLPNDFNIYDSCVNDVIMPSIYVIFSKNQCYPTYLIEYTEKLAPPSQNPPVTGQSPTLPGTAKTPVQSPVSPNMQSASSVTPANVSYSQSRPEVKITTYGNPYSSYVPGSQSQLGSPVTPSTGSALGEASASTSKPQYPNQPSKKKDECSVM